jgi:hypothetical protein
MKTKRFFIFGLPVVLLALGLVLAGCGEEDGENTDPKKITVTGITDTSSTAARILLASNFNDDGIVASGNGTILNGSVTVSLLKADAIVLLPKRYQFKTVAIYRAYRYTLSI